MSSDEEWKKGRNAPAKAKKRYKSDKKYLLSDGDVSSDSSEELARQRKDPPPLPKTAKELY